MSIEYHEPSSSWHLSGPGVSYVVAAGSDGMLRNLHWGAPIGDEDAAALASAPRGGARPSSFHVAGGDEVAAYGGAELRTPSVLAEFADGTRTLDLAVGGHRIDGDRLDIELVDRAFPFQIALHYLPRGRVIDRWATVVNTGEEPVVLRAAFSADIRLPERATRLSYLHGGWAAEPRLDRIRLPEGRVELDGRGGFTSHRARPWFAVDDGAASEEAGEVWSASLAWSGSWRLAVERAADGGLHAVIGMHDLDFGYRLDPGESLALPAVALLYADGGFGAASRGWHEYQRSRLLRSAAPRPVLYNSWEATAFDVSLAGQSALAERAARIGCELFVVDDGWFVGRRDDHAGLGDWYTDEKKLPGGLDPLITRVHELGMAFGLWVEPEMVNPDSDLYRAHPDWVYHFPSRPRTELRNQLVLNLARADVGEFVYATLDRLLRAHDIAFIKWDFNRPITEPGWPDAPHGNPQRLWVDHVRGLYAILDRLRDAHPAVAFEACSGGGGRTDLGMIARTDQVWISDNTDAVDRLVLQHGYTQAYAPTTMVSWVTSSPSHVNARRAPLAFRFHVSMTGVLGVGDDLTTWTEADMAEAATHIAAYKQIRDLVCSGDLYRLSPAPEVSAVEYVAADRRRAVLFAFAHGRKFGARETRIRLAGLDPDRSYVVDGERPLSGRLLMACGLTVPLRGDTASAMVRLD